MKLHLSSLSLLAALLIGCGSPTAAMDVQSGLATSPQAPAVAANATNAVQRKTTADTPQSLLTNRMVIRDATLSVRVESVEKAEKRVNSMVTDLGGYVDTATSTDLSSNSPSITISARIPSAQFDATIDRMEALGTVLSKTVSSQDVTEQVVDLDARSKTMLAEEDVVRGMLRQTRRLEDMISLEQRLSDIRANIESTIAQRQSLAKRASMSSINLNLQQEAVISASSKDPGWLIQTWGEASTTMGSAVRALAAMAVWVITFSPFWIPVLLILRRFLPRPRSNPTLPPSSW